MSELVRANKVTVKVDGNGYVAQFFRTHKELLEVRSSETGFVMPPSLTKSGEREAFRGYVVENADKYGINWLPQDLRPANVVHKARYTNDQELIDDAYTVIRNMVNEFADKCKYPITVIGLEFDSITPMVKTGKGTDLSVLGIEDGKYKNSGNWAWAKIEMIATVKYKEDMVYLTVNTELISGQLKKPSLGITAFNDLVRTNIIADGIATAEELDPPKDAVVKPVVKPVSTVAEEPAEEPVAEEPIVEVPVKKSRKSKESK